MAASHGASALVLLDVDVEPESVAEAITIWADEAIVWMSMLVKLHMHQALALTTHEFAWNFRRDDVACSDADGLADLSLD